MKEKGLMIVINPGIICIRLLDSWLKPEKMEASKNKKRLKRFTKEYAVTNKYWIPYIL